MRDVLDGTVPVAGVELTVLRLPVEEMFYRFLMHGEFDVSVQGLGILLTNIRGLGDVSQSACVTARNASSRKCCLPGSS